MPHLMLHMIEPGRQARLADFDYLAHLLQLAATRQFTSEILQRSRAIVGSV